MAGKTIDQPTMSLEDALSELEEHQRNGTTNPDPTWLNAVMERDKAGRQYLPVSEIKRRVAVFQPRSLIGQRGEEHAVLGELQDALRRRGVEDMDPVIVWWSGKMFTCVDGHHRLIAIKRFNSDQMKKAQTAAERRLATEKALKVPVSVITGPLTDALGWSTKENGKAKISLRKQDRSNWAWKQGALHWGGIIDGKFVMARRCIDLHVSERLLKQMKATFRKISERHPSNMDREEIIDLAEGGWSNAQALAEGRSRAETWDDARRDAEIERIVARLMKALSADAFSTTRAELTGEAILRISGRFLELASGSPEVATAMADTMSMLAAWDAMDYDEEELGF